MVMNVYIDISVMEIELLFENLHNICLISNNPCALDKAKCILNFCAQSFSYTNTLGQSIFCNPVILFQNQFYLYMNEGTLLAVKSFFLFFYKC